MATSDALAASNPKIKRLRRLEGRRNARLEEGAFLVEGSQLIDEAFRSDIEFEAIYADAGGSLAIDHFAAIAAERGIPTYRVSKGVLGNVMPVLGLDKICAVAPSTLHRPLDEVIDRAVELARPLLVLVDTGVPGNAGTLIRAAEAAGCAGVLMLGYAVDMYHPTVVRATAGSLFRVPIAVERDTSAALAALRSAGCTVIAAVARDGVAHLDAPLAGAVALVLGNEAHGLSDADVAACDLAVTITMDGPAESLNVAMAGTVLCFEALRQRSTL